MVNWSDLDAEIQLWRDEGRIPTLWWRDDDAQKDSAALRRLSALSAKYAVPLALAAIPKGCEQSLVDVVEDNPGLSILQHGYSHLSYAPVTERKCELGSHRPIVTITDELTRGLQQLREMFGSRFHAVLVPPWNRLSLDVVDSLPASGFVGLSTLGPRSSGSVELVQVNVHVDLIDWKGGRKFAGEERALGQLIDHLRLRRLEKVDPLEATGVMTHHLVHDEPLWVFLERLLSFTHEAGVRWCSTDELFR
ncbi:polysaccharide deacetylase family protein [Marinobacterium lacunae]|uniref:polysaccharide deacetylase family protein n=1 Tax=Marinobacterium lacunae TaxID=1232683 RepID=UPI000564AD0D|nr:polysaccharide deacetylase family protein [Marinobacterium lacunae]